MFPGTKASNRRFNLLAFGKGFAAFLLVVDRDGDNGKIVDWVVGGDTNNGDTNNGRTNDSDTNNGSGIRAVSLRK